MGKGDNVKPKEYEIKTLLDFAKIPDDKVKDCLKDFEQWIYLCKLANETTIFLPVEEFIWIDDDKNNMTIRIINPECGDND